MSFFIFPLKTLDEVSGADFSGETPLQFAEEPLKLIYDAVCWSRMNFFVVLPAVDGLSELGGHEEGLKEAVHVAGGPDIRESFII